MSDRVSDKEINNYARHQWWERNKHEVLAYTIMTIMVVSFICYLIYAYTHGWNIRFN